jgi:hypothetical protein
MLSRIKFFCVQLHKGCRYIKWGEYVGGHCYRSANWSPDNVVVYYRQKKISDKQEKVLARMYDLTTTHQVILNKIFSLEEKTDAIIERKFPEK